MGYTLTAKSQVTLPKTIRDYLKVAPGDAVDFRIAADGSVKVEPVRAGPKDLEPSEQSLAKFRKLQGTLASGLSTDEWMNLLRGYDEDASDPGFANDLPAPPVSRRR